MNTVIVRGTSGVIFAALLGGQVIGQSLGQRVREVEVVDNLNNKPVPKWENGFMLAYEHSVQPPAVSIFNNNGQILATASIVIPDAIRVWIEGTAASQDGSVAVAGPAMKANGAVASYIAWLTNRGTIERIVRTSPFAPRRLCFAADGTLWAVGREMSADGRTELPHDLLRRYDRTGKMIGSFLPNTEFARYSHESPAEDSFLMATNDSIGFYSASSRIFVEVDYSGAVIGRWTGFANGRDFEITGAGMVRGGSAYLSSTRRNIGGRRGSSSPEYYVLDRQQSTWIRLDAPGLFGTIRGTQDEQLVVGNGGSKFVWIAAK